MSGYFDRQGKPISIETWSEMTERIDANRVAETTLPDGKWVSTIWLGLDHRYDDGPPLIFETMVFPKHGVWNELDCERYATEAEALAGHKAMVEHWSATGG